VAPAQQTDLTILSNSELLDDFLGKKGEKRDVADICNPMTDIW
jgi:hypothetical protein